MKGMCVWSIPANRCHHWKKGGYMRVPGCPELSSLTDTPCTPASERPRIPPRPNPCREAVGSSNESPYDSHPDVPEFNSADINKGVEARRQHMVEEWKKTSSQADPKDDLAKEKEKAAKLQRSTTPKKMSEGKQREVEMVNFASTHKPAKATTKVSSS